MNHNRHRFTLIEILAVVGIMAILAGIAIGAIGFVQKKNSETRTQATIEILRLGLEQYKQAYGFYLPSGISGNYVEFVLDEVNMNDNNPASANNINNNFCKFIEFGSLVKQCRLVGDRYHVLDGFGRPVYYRSPGSVNRGSFDLGSLGADGMIGAGAANVPSGTNRTQFTDDFGKGDDITNCKR